jgi:hypothetical protein
MLIVIGKYKNKVNFFLCCLSNKALVLRIIEIYFIIHIKCIIFFFGWCMHVTHLNFAMM